MDVSIRSFYVNRNPNGSSTTILSVGGSGSSIPADMASKSNYNVFTGGSNISSTDWTINDNISLKFGQSDQSNIKWNSTNNLLSISAASGVEIETNELRISGIASEAGTNFLQYNTSTGKVTYGTSDAIIVSLSNLANKDALLYDSSIKKWRNKTTFNIGNYFVRKAGDTMTGDLRILTSLYVCDTVKVDNHVNTNTVDSSLIYISGYAGQGFRLNLDESGETSLEVDNLNVRKKLSAYELEIREINSVNGGLVISAANGIPYSVVGTRLYFDTDENNSPIQFAVNDFIKAQRWTGDASGYYIGKVTHVVQNASLGYAYIDASTVSGAPWTKMKLVQHGNSTNATRQSLIYITSTDTGNPYIDLCASVNAGTLIGTHKLRIGNLSGISDIDFGGNLTGYGLYANNVYLKGSIQITGGSGFASLSDRPTSLTGINSTEGSKLTGIEAGATVGATSAQANKLTGIEAGATVGATSAQVTAISNAATTATWAGIGSKPVRFGDAPSGSGLFMCADYMGYHNGSGWNSYIGADGTAKFVGVTEFGTSTQYYTGNWNLALKGADLWENTGANFSNIYINRLGYQQGSTYFRNTTIGDGKGHAAFIVNSQTNTIYTGTNGGVYNTGWALEVRGSVTGTDFIMGSDERLKQNIKPLKIEKVDVEYKEFELKAKPNETRYGIIAQELQRTNPELVHEDKDGMLSVSYIDLLIRKVAYLESKLNEMERRMK